MAQQDVENPSKPQFEVKKYTLMEQFEPEMVVTVAERIQLKEERFDRIQERRGILDTLDVSERRKRKLLRDIYKNPLSDRLSRAMVTEPVEMVEKE
jgi:hypothetical protein